MRNMISEKEKIAITRERMDRFSDSHQYELVFYLSNSFYIFSVIKSNQYQF